MHPSRLELEVTETLLLNDEPATRETLLKVRELGVRIALDDFGTGYASLSYLRRFPFNKLKIDQTFVRDIADQQVSTAIVRAVASLASSLDIVAVAEGVETKAHLARVAAAGCTQVQGYLFSRPVPASDIQGVIATCAIPTLDDAGLAHHGFTTTSITIAIISAVGTSLAMRKNFGVRVERSSASSRCQTSICRVPLRAHDEQHLGPEPAVLEIAHLPGEQRARQPDHDHSRAHDVGQQPVLHDLERRGRAASSARPRRDRRTGAADRATPPSTR